MTAAQGRASLRIRGQGDRAGHGRRDRRHRDRARSTRRPSTPAGYPLRRAHGDLRRSHPDPELLHDAGGGQLPGRPRLDPRVAAGGLRARQEGAGADGHPAGPRGAAAAGDRNPADRRRRAEPALRGGRALRPRGRSRRSPRPWRRPGRRASHAEGPLPADTVFSKMRGGMYDLVVVMYHDQGHIPTKLMGFQYDDKTGTWGQMAGVNVTLGLPIIRVSVDHGTAFGKAGEGRANPQSMIEAVTAGGEAWQRRRKILRVVGD
ncbi:MAG: 4-hydroxythreonine-4-phosphate dehydrogenase PdxA [Desulfobacterales bacterium]|nr:4-hydroxythreonine-4-phosphate dehydrogenase PdxA [Desulfobacterales bacterium]